MKFISVYVKKATVEVARTQQTHRVMDFITHIRTNTAALTSGYFKYDISTTAHKKKNMV